MKTSDIFTANFNCYFQILTNGMTIKLSLPCWRNRRKNTMNNSRIPADIETATRVELACTNLGRFVIVSNGYVLVFLYGKNIARQL